MIDNGTKGFGGTVTVTVTREEDKAKYDFLTDEEKAMLADVTSAAAMSLQDSHGDYSGSHPGFAEQPGCHRAHSGIIP